LKLEFSDYAGTSACIVAEMTLKQRFRICEGNDRLATVDSSVF